MKVLDHVKKGFSVAKGNMPLAFVLILLYLIYFAINYGLNSVSGLGGIQEPSQDPSQMLRQFVTGTAISLIVLIIQNYIQAGLVGYVGDTLKKGRQTLSAFFVLAKKYAIRLFLQGIVITVLFFVLFLIAVFIMGALTATLNTIGTVIGAVFVAPIIYLSLLLFYSSYILVLEDKPIIASMKNSIGFVRKNLAGFLALIVTFLILILIPLGILVGFLTLMKAPLEANQPVAVGVSLVAAPIFVFILAFYGIAVTSAVISFYLDRSGQPAVGS